MAIAFRLSTSIGRDLLAAAWKTVIATHGTLRTAFVDDGSGAPSLREFEFTAGQWIQHEIVAGQTMSAALQSVLDEHCRPFSRPAHRLCMIETADGPTLIVAADHAHVDMWSMLVITRDLLANLEDLRQGRTPEPKAVPTFAEHTQALAARPPAPSEIHRRWKQLIDSSGGGMPRFPLPLGASTLQPERVEVRDVLDSIGLVAYSERAKRSGVSALALTISAMTDTTRELAGAVLRTVFPVHSRYDPCWHDSVGWFITNSVLESGDPDPSACAAAVKESLRLGSYPLAEIMRPWGGMPELPGMLAVSWLDMRRLPVTIDALSLAAQYVSAGIQTDSVMLWFITDSVGIHLRCRYPDTMEARRNVGAWLDDLVTRMRGLGGVNNPQPNGA